MEVFKINGDYFAVKFAECASDGINDNVVGDVLLCEKFVGLTREIKRPVHYLKKRRAQNEPLHVWASYIS